MLLTKKILNNILQNWRVSIPADLERELLDQYGGLAADPSGHVFEYTEQDIYEQLRKILYRHDNSNGGGEKGFKLV